MGINLINATHIVTVTFPMNIRRDILRLQLDDPTMLAMPRNISW